MGRKLLMIMTLVVITLVAGAHPALSASDRVEVTSTCEKVIKGYLAGAFYTKIESLKLEWKVYERKNATLFLVDIKQFVAFLNNNIKGMLLVEYRDGKEIWRASFYLAEFPTSQELSEEGWPSSVHDNSIAISSSSNRFQRIVAIQYACIKFVKQLVNTGGGI